ncbi:metallophosphoesterase [Pseudomonas sp. KK4]|uniref:metallophosphoesterase n=1 Tax=Pseudomonas sp. KK4 TaxID=1855729 RepID=UPI0021140091|nr:metallophosphoesterase [Pseudomonas sp. KK4]
MGDIHGHFELLRSLISQVKFDTTRDRIFSVGDLIDRGPNSAQVTVWLQEPWFHAVRGNHEQMLIECISGTGDIPRHIRNGGAWIYDLPPYVQLDITHTLHQLPIMIEIELLDSRRVGIVHAEAPILLDTDTWQEAKNSINGNFGQENQQNALTIALYSRKKIERSDTSTIKGLSNLYVGHSTVPSVISLGNVSYIDTGCSFGDGALSLIELTSGAVFSETM